MPRSSSKRSAKNQNTSLLSLGRNIREARSARGVILSELAQACGKSIGYLSQVENGRSRPTVADLQAIAGALGVQLGFFFDNQNALTKEGTYVVRRNHVRRLTLENGITNDLLSPSLEGPIELLRTTLDPGARSGDDYSHRGCEAGHVIEGTLELWIDGEQLILEAGDSFAFDCRNPHKFGNPGVKPTTVLWVLTPPTI
jgi:transcriptional regulator with XRE-family HTH domain